MKRIIALCAALFVPLVAEASVEIQDAWSRATLQRSMSGVVYMKIANTSGVDDALVEVSSPVARMVQIHRTTTDESGMMSMDHVEKVVLKNDTYVQLEPGDLHIMLMGLNQQLLEGNEFPLTLKFENSPEQTVRVLVKPISYKGE